MRFVMGQPGFELVKGFPVGRVSLHPNHDCAYLPMFVPVAPKEAP